MEILAVEMKTDVAPNTPAAFIQRSGADWPTGRTGSSSLKILRTAIPALKNDQHLIVTPEYSPQSARDDLTEFCEVFYNLARGQWFAWPQRLEQVS
jgi:hypothetical protein